MVITLIVVESVIRLTWRFVLHVMNSGIIESSLFKTDVPFKLLLHKGKKSTDFGLQFELFVLYNYSYLVIFIVLIIHQSASLEIVHSQYKGIVK